MTNPVRRKQRVYCCACPEKELDFHDECNMCFELCECECNHNCNCLAKWWFCNPCFCYSLFKIIICPFMPPLCITYLLTGTAVQVAVMPICCMFAGTRWDERYPKCCSPVDKFQECGDVCFHDPICKMCNEITCGLTYIQNGSSGAKNFETTSYPFFKKTFCTRASAPRAPVAVCTVQPKPQKASNPSSVLQVPHVLPSQADQVDVPTISEIKVNPRVREEFSDA